MPVDYSIIIPAYNEEDFLPATLERVREVMERIDYKGEIIVADNNSTDRTAEIAESFGAKVVFEPHRQISRNRNTGARASEGRFLIFLDADTLIEENLLLDSLKALESGEVCAGGTTVRMDSDKKAVTRTVNFWNFLSRRMHWACGAYVFCLREAFESVGGFSEEVYISEEIFLSRKLRKWGKPKGLKMIIFDKQIQSSARKVEWYTLAQTLKMLLMIFIFPFLIRSRWACGYWYERPKK